MNRVTEELNCSERAVNKLNILLDYYAQDTVNLLCGDYTDDSDKCQTIIGRTPEWKGPLKYKSFVVAMAEIIESLNE